MLTQHMQREHTWFKPWAVICSLLTLSMVSEVSRRAPGCSAAVGHSAGSTAARAMQGGGCCHAIIGRAPMALCCAARFPQGLLHGCSKLHASAPTVVAHERVYDFGGVEDEGGKVGLGPQRARIHGGIQRCERREGAAWQAWQLGLTRRYGRGM